MEATRMLCDGRGDVVAVEGVENFHVQTWREKILIFWWLMYIATDTNLLRSTVMVHSA